MPFMVIYSTSDGASCHEQADAIDEAALFVERLRNKDGIEEVRIYRMEEISFAFRPYYKVELGMPERQTERPTTAPTSNVIGSIPQPPVADEPRVVNEPDPDGRGRRGCSGGRGGRAVGGRAATAITPTPTAAAACSDADPLGSPQRLIDQRSHRQGEQADHRGRAHPQSGEQERQQQAGAHPNPPGSNVSLGDLADLHLCRLSARDLSRGPLLTTLCADATARLTTARGRARPLRRWCAAAGAAAGSRSWWWSSCWGSRCSEPRSFRCRM